MAVGLGDPEAVRALFHAFPGGQETYRPLFIEAKTGQLRLVGQDLPRVLVGELVLTGAEVDAEFDGHVARESLRRSLAPAMQDRYEGSLGGITLAADRAGVVFDITVGHGTRIRRSIRYQEGSLRRTPLDILGRHDSTISRKIRPTFLDECAVALRRDKENPIIDLHLAGGQVSASATYIDGDGAIQLEAPDIEGPDSSAKLDWTILSEVGSAASAARGIGVKELAIATNPHGLIQVQYQLNVGRLTYWIAPIIE